MDGPGESAYFISVCHPPLSVQSIHENQQCNYTQQVNRNKKSLALSFASTAGQQILQTLAKSCDVLVENYLPNSLAKYNLDYASLSALNPSLIYASITGYGQTGPYSPRAGYDVMVEAEMGLMHITGDRDGPPVKVGVAVTDLTTGLYTSNAIMAALIARDRGRLLQQQQQQQQQEEADHKPLHADGGGQHIDIALSDCQVATLTNLASSCLISGLPDTGRWGTAHPSIVPYRAFRTADSAILLGGGNDKLFTSLCTYLSHPEWSRDPRFQTNALRVRNRHELEPLIEDVTAGQTTEAWLGVLEGSGIPYAAVNDVQATLAHEHVRARGMVKEVPHPTCGTLRMLDTPVKYSVSKPGIRMAPPVLGQHTDEVLREVVGLAEGEIRGLREDGVVA